MRIYPARSEMRRLKNRIIPGNCVLNLVSAEDVETGIQTNVSFLTASSIKRSGLTLLEIVLSLAIFCGALTALSQLAWNGSRATVHARLKTQATIRCEAKLNEVLAGVEAMQGHSSTSFPDDNKWSWSMVVTPGSQPELVQLDVTVSHRGNSTLSNIDVTLRRWAREQFIFAAGAKQVKEEETKAKEKAQ